MLMDFYDAVRQRYSCRAYQARPVEKDTLERVLEAARLAPSAKNLQDWRFVLVTDEEKRKAVARAANNQMFIAAAPVIIAGCSVTDQVMRCGQPIAAIDLAIAMEHIALAAAAEGLGTCWIGSFYPDQVREILLIPDTVAVIELMPLGYPADTHTRKPHAPLDRIVCYESWGWGRP
jgi:nitroreductase